VRRNSVISGKVYNNANMGNDQKAIIKINKKDLGIKINKGIEKYLQKPALWFTEALTGGATYGRKDFILAGGQLMQGAIKLDLWGELLYQLNKAREKGKTKKKFYESRNARINFNELFSYLDKNDTPDEEIFKAIRGIFFASIRIDSQQKDEILAYQLIQVCKKMRSIDLIILLAAYELYLKQKDGLVLNIQSTQDWQIKISEMINLPIDLVVQSRIEFSFAGNNQGTSPYLFSVGSSATGGDMLNMGLNALSISLGKFIVDGERLISS
jgi:hypothetical protein